MIKPCPFCGGVDIRHYAASVGRRFKCRECHAEGPAVLKDIRGSTTQETDRLRMEAARDLWNKRATLEVANCDLKT